VVAELVHLVRHGEVHNPEGVLYGRLPGYHLSELGHKMAASAAKRMAGREISAVYASPLQRAQESAQPWADTFGLQIRSDERLIEPFNRFEGRRAQFGPQVLANPANWPFLANPMRPSWGEPFSSIAQRMLAVAEDAYLSAPGGEVVLVSHQLPIWMVARSVHGKRLPHDPRRRRCALSSITTLARRGGAFVEVDYQNPAADLLAASVDFGAV
jgi:broad specificity phosphatase PhoE